ncbi:MAG: dihydrofolate reductase family protein [Candidatus Wildermuthbacteria bacterium]|nr:dihydrofolate reductase family protein [Candidatus Wildermuthbacteria bacterium]
MNRPYTTLFLLVSVDGKISTGDTDTMDVDKDYPRIDGVKEGLKQYYDLEMETDLFSLNTGRVFAKVGMNEKTDEPKKLPVSFVVIDNEPHLTERGVSYLAKKSKNLIVATTNKTHSAISLKNKFDNISVFEYQGKVDFGDLFSKLKEQFGAERLTIQSGGTLNTTLVREGLVDRVFLVIAPALVGGKNTSTLMDGESLHAPDELNKIKALELVEAKPLKNSYLLLEYKVKN